MFWLDAEFKVAGKRQGRSCNSFELTIADAIEKTREDILKDYPNATDIVVAEQPKNGGNPYMLDKLIECIQSVRPDLSTEHLNENHYLILHTDRNSYSEGGFWMNLPDAKKYMANKDNCYNDYVYLRRFGIVLFNVGSHTSHEAFTSHWNWIETVLFNDTTKTMDDVPDLHFEDASEAFLHNKCGFFQSRAFNMRTVLKSANMKLTANEKMAFGDINFRDIEP